MRKIKIAQIGTSTESHGNYIFNSLKRQNAIFEIIGFALPENEREKFPERMAEFEGFQELSVEEILKNPEIEAVAIETEECYLTKYAQAAADAGKHIHMEKPGGESLADYEKLIQTVKNHNLVFHTGYMYRYNPYVQDLMRKVRDGELGKIISVEAQMSCAHSLKTRKWLEKYKGGSLFFLGCHLVDLILQIQGKPDKIIPLSKKTGTDGVTAKDFGMAVLEYPYGVSFAKVNSSEIGGYARRQLVVTGTEKTVELKPLEMYGEGELLFTTRTEYSSEVWANRGTQSNSFSFERFDSMMSAFAEMVRGERQNPYTYDYELELYKTVLKCCGIKEKE